MCCPSRFCTDGRAAHRKRPTVPNFCVFSLLVLCLLKVQAEAQKRKKLGTPKIRDSWPFPSSCAVRLVFALMVARGAAAADPRIRLNGAIEQLVRGRNLKLEPGHQQHPGPENQDSQHKLNQPSGSFPDSQGEIKVGASKNYQYSTEGQKFHQNFAPVVVIILWNSLVFSRKCFTSTDFTGTAPRRASTSIVVKKQSPKKGQPKKGQTEPTSHFFRRFFHRVLQGVAQRGAQFDFIFAALRTPFFRAAK